MLCVALDACAHRKRRSWSSSACAHVVRVILEHNFYGALVFCYDAVLGTTPAAWTETLMNGVLGWVTLLALINCALGWVTLSQARLGAQLADIREQTRGNYTHTTPPMQSLGYLWSLPDDPSSSAGLGGGIAWAWDSSLCGQLQDRFHEDAMLFEWIDCDMLKAALHRAFYSWSSNHPLIQFVDVTKECDALYGGLGPNCPLAELWVTALTPTRRALTTDTTGADLEPVYAALSSHGTSQEEVGEEQSDGGRVAARASPTARYSTDFRWTSGIPAGGGSSANRRDGQGGHRIQCGPELLLVH